MSEKADFSMKPHVLFEGSVTDPFLVVFKPSGMPSAPLCAGQGGSALECVADLFPSVLSVFGKKEIEGGLLHRLDTDTEGLLLVALTQNCYDALQTAQREGQFVKYYRALCKKQPILPVGFPECPVNICATRDFPLDIYSRFRPFGEGRRQVRPLAVSESPVQSRSAEKKAGREIYKTVVHSCASVPDFEGQTGIFELEYALTKGFRHQLRCHSAWLGLPIIGDRLYKSECAHTDQTRNDDTPVEKLQLLAKKIVFPHPNTGLLYTFSL